MFLLCILGSIFGEIYILITPKSIYYDRIIVLNLLIDMIMALFIFLNRIFYGDGLNKTIQKKIDIISNI